MGMFETNILMTGLIVFVARICDVSIGTVRTIVTVQGRTVIAFCLAVFEISIWITIVSTVIHQVKDNPVLIAFYAFGYATGNVVGIMVERKIAFGTTILRIITRTAGSEIAAYLREKGQPVTIFHGEGMHSPVHMLYIACRRRDLKWILPQVQQIDPELFYVIEQAREIRKVLKPVFSPLGGWRSADKRK